MIQSLIATIYLRRKEMQTISREVPELFKVHNLVAKLHWRRTLTLLFPKPHLPPANMLWISPFTAPSLSSLLGLLHLEHCAPQVVTVDVG